MLHLLFLLSAVGLKSTIAAPTSSCVSGAAVPGTTCVQECNTDRYGGDIGSLQAASLQDCGLACYQDSRCLTAQYNRANGYCYLKSTLNGPQTNNDVDGVVCRQPSTPTSSSSTSPSAGACPTDVSYTSSGAQFVYTCGLDYYGGDYRTVYDTPSVEACVDVCALESQCLQLAWHQDTHVCYLKNGDTTERMQAGDWAGKRVTSAPSSTTSATTTTPPSTTTTQTTTLSTTSSTTTYVAPFSCPTQGYMVAVTNNVPTLFSVDVPTGQRTPVKSPLGDGTSINAIGYNTIDNRLYGVQNKNPPRIIRIGSDGAIAAVKDLPITPSGGGYNTGDVDYNGNFWVAYNGREWVEINLASNTIVASGTATLPFSIYDWSYVPNGGAFLYAISVDARGATFLMRFSLTTHVWSQVGTGYGTIYPSNGVVGAIYASQDGFLYSSENSEGKIYKLSLDGKTSTFISTGPRATSNDGAHCVLNSVF